LGEVGLGQGSVS